MSEQVPSVGRIVHFVYGDKHVPAIIVDPEYHIIDPGTYEAPIQQALTVFPFFAQPFGICAVHDADAKPGTWHWCEYVHAKETSS